MISPSPTISSPLSVIWAVFTASILGSGAINTSVGSFVVFPSESSPSSLTSDIVEFETVSALAITLFTILPVSDADCSMM